MVYLVCIVDTFLQEKTCSDRFNQWSEHLLKTFSRARKSYYSMTKILDSNISQKPLSNFRRYLLLRYENTDRFYNAIQEI